MKSREASRSPTKNATNLYQDRFTSMEINSGAENGPNISLGMTDGTKNGPITATF